MSVRDAKAPGIALAGVAVAGLLAGGMVFSNAMDGPAAAVPSKPALASPTPRWHDGYNHFILTVAAPLSPGAAKILISHQDRSGDRRPAVTPEALGAGPGVKSAGLMVDINHAGKSAAARDATTGAGASSGSAAPAGGHYSIPWQAVAPDPSDPIVLRPGQPASLLAKAMARFPKGTRLERDREGNIRAVLPPGWHWVPARDGKHAHRNPSAGHHGAKSGAQ